MTSFFLDKSCYMFLNLIILFKELTFGFVDPLHFIFVSYLIIFCFYVYYFLILAFTEFILFLFISLSFSVA